MQPVTTLTLERRRALLWVKQHQPTQFPSSRDTSAPTHRTIIELKQEGLIGLDPTRKRFDTIRFCLTEAAEQVLADHS